MLGKQCVASLWGPRTWQRMEEGDKEVVFLACLHRVRGMLEQEMPGVSQLFPGCQRDRFGRLPWESRKVERSRRRSLGFSASCGTALVSARGWGIGRLCRSFQTGATWYSGPREASKYLPCPSACCPLTGGHCLLPMAAF